MNRTTKQGVTVVMPGGGSRNFPNCKWVKAEMDLTGRITRTRLGDKENGNIVGFAPPDALIVVHWKSST